MIRTVILAAVAVLAAIPSHAQQWQKDKLAGQSSSICETKTVVIKSEKEWHSLWKEHAGPQAQAPQVDFSKEMVVGVFLGERMKAGTTIEITVMPDPLDKNRLVVFYKEIAPKGGFGATMISHPYALLKVKIHGTVAFEVNGDYGVPQDERKQVAPKRITPDQKVHMNDMMEKLGGFCGFDCR